MQIPPGTNIVHTVTASFSLSVKGGTPVAFSNVTSGGPQNSLEANTTGSISDIGDAIILQQMDDFAHCNYLGNFFGDDNAISYINPSQITSLQNRTNTGQYAAFTPYVDTPQSPQQTLIINGLDLTADGESNPPTVCINSTYAANAAITVTGFHLGGLWSVSETDSTGVSQIAIPCSVDSTAMC